MILESTPPVVEPIPRRRKRHLLFGMLLTPGVAWMAVFYLVPLALIVAMSLGTSDDVGRPQYGWNPSNYQQVFDATFLPVLVRTLCYAIVATAISLVIGYAVAYTIARYGGRAKTLILLAVILPFFVDYIVRIYALVQIFRDDGVLSQLLYGTGLVEGQSMSFIGHTPVVILGLVYNYLPLMILPIYVAIEQLDASLLEASRDLYASGSQTLWLVTLPLTLAGIAGGCLLVFLSTVGDFITAQLLGGPGNFMLGNLINSEFNGSASVPIGAGLTVVLIVLLALLAMGYVLRANRSKADPR